MRPSKTESLEFERKPTVSVGLDVAFVGINVTMSCSMVIERRGSSSLERFLSQNVAVPGASAVAG